MNGSSTGLSYKILTTILIVIIFISIPSLLESTRISWEGDKLTSTSSIKQDSLRSGYAEEDSLAGYLNDFSEDRSIVSISELKVIGESDLKEPVALCADPRGFVFVSDGLTGMVFRYNLDGESLEFEQPSVMSAIYPVDIACVGSYVYVLDYSSMKILRYDFRGAYLDILVALGELNYLSPVSLSIANDGRLIIADAERYRITLWTPLMDFQVEIGEFESGVMGLVEPVKAVSLSSGIIAVLDAGDRKVKLFSPSGSFDGLIDLKGQINVADPKYLCVDRYDNIFVVDGGGKVLVIRPNGRYIFTVDSFNGRSIVPSAVVCGWNNELFVTDIKSHSVLVYTINYR